jgi:hypothetical protein
MPLTLSLSYGVSSSTCKPAAQHSVMNDSVMTLLWVAVHDVQTPLGPHHSDTVAGFSAAVGMQVLHLAALKVPGQ